MKSLETYQKISGFTLIELAIVLVIIGLIVGGVLVGRDLIRAAGERAQVTQIEKFNSAANTFRGKYGYLPGDIKDPDASNFGFLPRGAYAGEGDGNGVIQGIDTAGCAAPSATVSYNEDGGETLAFWVDLATARMIEGSYQGSPTCATTPSPATLTTSPAISAFIPAAKIGGSNYIYVWSGGVRANGTGLGNSINYYGLSAVTSLTMGGGMISAVGLSVRQAYDIDKKLDDGLPQSGSIQAFYLNILAQTTNWAGTVDTSATTGSATTCYDNNATNGATQQYSTKISDGANINCALSFQFQ